MEPNLSSHLLNHTSRPSRPNTKTRLKAKSNHSNLLLNPNLNHSSQLLKPIKPSSHLLEILRNSRVNPLANLRFNIRSINREL